MAKLSLGLKLSEAGIAKAREGYSGELPPTGSYSGVLKALTMDVIGPNAKPENVGKPKWLIGVELRNTPGGKYDGFMAWNNMNLIESSAEFINQFLMALTDGSDEQFTAIQKAFDSGNMGTDERQKHVEFIGRWKINSPNGELPIKVSLKKRNWYDEKSNRSGETVDLVSFLVNENGGVPSNRADQTGVIAEEETVAEVVPEDDEDIVVGSDDESLLS